MQLLSNYDVDTWNIALSIGEQQLYSSQRFNELFTSFGQFLDHDLSLTTPAPQLHPEASIPIPVPKGDPWFDTEATGQQAIRVKRSL